jgi:hypothetical protein
MYHTAGTHAAGGPDEKLKNSSGVWVVPNLDNFSVAQAFTPGYESGFSSQKPH